MSEMSELNILRIKKKEAYRDGIKRKGDKIGMGYIKHGDFRMLTPLTPSHNPYIIVA